ncbi:MAG: pyruvate ferredoxin oxidoreductase, partial [Candidatus Methanomethylicia archaeon]
MRVVLTGNHAAAYAALLSRVEVVAAYPITPQTQIVEKLAEFIEGGRLKAKYIRVESEHSAMAAII